ncbi:MAG TPA: hypothetical protein VIJ75_00425 [Hanamia sp.]
MSNPNTIIETKVITINRSGLFRPATFTGPGWTITEEDQRALALTKIDFTKVVLKTTLNKKEKSIRGEDNLKRLKSMDCIRLDAMVFYTLWNDQQLIPIKWKENTNGQKTFIFFDGTVLRNSRSIRCVIYLYWYYHRWRWNIHWLENYWDANNLSAVLATSPIVY